MWGVLFPGQGSQSVGMGKLFFDEFSVVRETFEEASDILNLNVNKLIFEDPKSQLNLTMFTQPALLTVSTAYYRFLNDILNWDNVSYAAGHSLGEYSALVNSDVLSFSESLKATQLRGKYMQEAVPEGVGGMLACVGIEESEVEKVVKWTRQNFHDGVIEPANYNSQTQIVLSGHKSAVDFILSEFDAEKVGIQGRARFIPLNVSAPFHCSLMEPAQIKMKAVLESLNFQAPNRKLVQNVTAKECRDPQLLRKNLTDQITSPVKWTQSVLNIQKSGVSHFIELGPGKVLSGLIKKIDRENLTAFNIQSLEDIKVLEKELK